MASLLEIRISLDADPRDAAEMVECQCRLTETLAGLNICPCGRGQLPPIPADFELSDETWLTELEPFGLPIGTINSLEKYAVLLTVGEARAWLKGGKRVPQVDGKRIAKLKAAIEAAERWGK
jgi:hypothetical protein